MKTTKVSCANCNKEFEKQASKVKYFRKQNPNWNFFCNKECYKDFKTTSIDVKCASCSIDMKRRPSELGSKSGKYYCTKSCANRENNKLRDHENNPNFTSGISSYRKRALDHYGCKCTICGYDTIEVLEVHHRDTNRNNNEIENLDVLCPTHHKEFTVGIREY